VEHSSSVLTSLVLDGLLWVVDINSIPNKVTDLQVVTLNKDLGTKVAHMDLLRLVTLHKDIPLNKDIPNNNKEVMEEATEEAILLTKEEAVANFERTRYF
jgi:hypothetical protein